MIWRRLLWGVKFTNARPKDRPMLLGFAWHDASRVRLYYADEPTRALLFKTRDAAREWCAEQHAKNKDRTDCCADWRFRPVRVIETVRPA